MTEGGPTEERLSKLRHDLANPLSAIMAEAQLLLLRDPPLDKETLGAIRSIEEQSLRMRDLLHQTLLLEPSRRSHSQDHPASRAPLTLKGSRDKGKDGPLTSCFSPLTSQFSILKLSMCMSRLWFNRRPTMPSV